MGKLSNIKVFATDFDNTIAIHSKGAKPVIKSTWVALHRALGTDAKDGELYKQYHLGKFDYLEWCRRDLELLKSAHLKEGQFTKIFTEELSITPGAKDLFDALGSKGITTAIISGGLENTYKIFADKFGFKCDYPRMAHKLNFDSAGNLVDGKFSNFDYEGKVHALQEICTLQGATLEECAFVGDELNDIPIFKKVGFSIAINSDNKELLSCAKMVIEDGELTSLLEEL